MLSARAASEQQYFGTRKYYPALAHAGWPRSYRVAWLPPDATLDAGRRTQGLGSLTTPSTVARSAARTQLNDVPWYPVAFAATYVLNLWVDSGVSVLAITRSLMVAMVAAGLILGVLAIVTRRPHLAGVLSLLAILVLLSRGPLYMAGLLTLAVAAALAVRLFGRIRRRPIVGKDITRALNAVSGVLLAVVLAGGMVRGTFGAVPADLQQGRGTLQEGDAPTPSDLPSIYVLMLDGYPRADSLERLFGGDNSSFLEELRARGFFVAENSESDYMFTQQTLTSMFHMKPLSEIKPLEPLADGSSEANPLMRQVLNDNPVFALARGQGYRVVTSSPGFEHVALRQSDVYLDDGQLNDFEYHLLRFTNAQGIVNLLAPDFFADRQRDRIRSGFEHFVEVTANETRPTLAFIHLPTPHLPVVFGSDGSDAPLPPSADIFDWPEIDGRTRDAYVRQLTYLNARIIDVVDSALRANRSGVEPIILVMSDHGAAARPAVFVGPGTDEHYATFFASRTPDGSDPFGEDISPVNVFPRLFNAYLGTDLPEWPNDRYAGVGDQ